MRVLLGASVSEGTRGGVATYIRRVAEGVEKLGATVDVLWGEPTTRWMPGPAATLRLAHELASTAASSGYDVVAAQGGQGALLKPGGPGRVVTSHGDDREAWKARLAYAPIPVRQRFVTPLARLPLYHRAITRADVVIALHHGEAARFRTERRQEPDTVHVVPNGCGPVHADAMPVPGHIVFVGDWLPRKGSLIIPEILRAARSANPAVSLSLVGPHPTVTHQFDQHDREHVDAIGFVERSRTEAVLATSDALLMPSYFEGMPLSVLEAMSFGLPTVGFDIPGTTAAAGQAGVFVPTGDVLACAEALVRVTGDRNLRRQLSAEAFARSQRLTWAATAESTLAAYEHAAAASRTV
jgi:glycosyltransferase involved in cell wall biosynthesis